MKISKSILSAFGLATCLLALTCTGAPAAEGPVASMAYPAKEGFDRAPAFPGAEGFGKYTQGGRYGRVLFVTTLEDYDPATDKPIPGSLRKAIETSGSRTVLFRVSGTIELKCPLEIYKPFLTLAGQSAPGDGICLKNYGVDLRTYEVIIRHLRFRPGDETGTRIAARGESWQTDALEALSGDYASGHTKPGYIRNVIIDHCSFSWGNDETLSVTGYGGGVVTDITIQWCVISEGLNDSTHPEGKHSKGSIYNSFSKGNLSLHHTLYAHLFDRCPAGGSTGVLDCRNIVLYGGLSHGALNWNYVGNYIKRPRLPKYMFVKSGSNPFIFADGNLLEGADNEDQWSHFGGITPPMRRTTPHEVPAWAQVETHSAKDAYEQVLANAGAMLPKRDAVDRRVVEQVRSGTGKMLIDSQDEVGGWPKLKSSPPPLDSNNDGMPDEWSKRYGLNPQSVEFRPGDQDAVFYLNNEASRDLDGDGYTNLEEYLNGTDPTRPDTELKLKDPVEGSPTGDGKAAVEGAKWTPPPGWFRGYDPVTKQHAR